MAGSARPITRRRSGDEGRAALSDTIAGVTASAVDGTMSGIVTHFSMLVLSLCQMYVSTLNVQRSTLNPYAAARRKDAARRAISSRRA